MKISEINKLTEFTVSRDIGADEWNVNLNGKHFCDIDKNDRGKFEAFNIPASVSMNQFTDINTILDAFNKQT